MSKKFIITIASCAVLTILIGYRVWQQKSALPVSNSLATQMLKIRENPLSKSINQHGDNHEKNTHKFALALEPQPFIFPRDHGPHLDYRVEWWYFTGNLKDKNNSNQKDNHFGFQLTFFRFGLHPRSTKDIKNSPMMMDTPSQTWIDAKQSSSSREVIDNDISPPQSRPQGNPNSAAQNSKGHSWQTDNIYMVHFGLTDVTSKKFVSHEEFARNSIGLAGAEASPFRVWVNGFCASEAADCGYVAISDQASVPSNSNNDALQRLAQHSPDTSTSKSPNHLLPPLWLKAKAKGYELNLKLDLNLDSKIEAGEQVSANQDIHKSIVLQGNNGLSQKSSGHGNASYYYSFTRIPATGSISLENKHYQVAGNIWFDREWSSSALDHNQSGWDWFALQLDDGTDIMFYRLRKTQQTNTAINDNALANLTDPHSAGVIVDKNGKFRIVDANEILITPLNWWTSPQTGIRYPHEWRLRTNSQRHKKMPSYDLRLSPLLANQEHAARFKYWEGAVAVTRYHQSQSAEKVNSIGAGYIELVGY